MAIPKLISMDHIKSVEEKQNKKFQNMLTNYDEQRNQSNELKLEWLAVYARSLSPSVACRISCVSDAQYRKWRQNDAEFCRAINRAIEGARDELMGSVLSRAIGYTREDPKNPGQAETDFDGKVIRHGASDMLAKRLLEMDSDEGKNSSAPVVVNINFKTLLGSNVAQLPAKSDPVTIEHDSVEYVEPDDEPPSVA